MTHKNGIYFVGASGTGKTTLSDYVAKEYKIPRMGSAAREVLGSYGVREGEFYKVLNDKARYHQYQRDVFLKQLELEEDMYANCEQRAFVADRAFDHLVFTALYGTKAHHIFHDLKMKEYLQRFADGTPDRTAIFFFVHPTKKAHEAALAAGDRKEYLNWEDMHRFDGAMEFIFQSYGIRYYPIGFPNLRERFQYIDGILQDGYLIHRAR